MKVEVGDKVRLKSGSRAGERAIIAIAKGSVLTVSLEQTGETLEVRNDAVTNFSLAARKAWRTEPDRRVGRRKGTRLCDRVSVTLRIDRDLWDEFQSQERAGTIDDRTAVVNAWLREKLYELAEGGAGVNAQAGHR